MNEDAQMQSNIKKFNALRALVLKSDGREAHISLDFRKRINALNLDVSCFAKVAHKPPNDTKAAVADQAESYAKAKRFA